MLNNRRLRLFHATRINKLLTLRGVSSSKLLKFKGLPLQK